MLSIVLCCTAKHVISRNTDNVDDICTQNFMCIIYHIVVFVDSNV